MQDHGHRQGNGWRVGVALTGLALTTFYGCSFLYDSATLADHIDPPEVINVDANPDSLTVETVAAAPALEEGYGDSGSRPALLVLEGADFTPETTVEITAADGTPVPGLAVQDKKVSRGHTRIAVTVSVTASAALEGDKDYPLKIVVSKPDALGAPLVQTRDWVLKGRHELERGGLILAEGLDKPHIYSKVDIPANTGALTVQGTKPLVMRSNSSFRIAVDLQLSASGQNGGPGGGAKGGAGGATGDGPSGGRGGAGGILGNHAGGGGFATAGFGGPTAAPPAGDAQITSFASNGSSGGGGGGVLGGALGGAGGGGGGAIELSARGELSVANITSNGGAGTAGLLNLGDGGGGTGGTIVLRTATKLTAGTLSAAGGRGGNANNSGSAGRIRVDAAEIGGGVTTPEAARGAMFDPATPMTVSLAELKVKLLSTAGTRFDLHAFDGAGQALLDAPLVLDFQGSSEVTAKVKLRHGYNLLCTTPPGSTINLTESANCLEIAFIDDNQ